MEFIWSYQIFGLLLDITVVIGRDKFGADRCIDDIEKGVAFVFIVGGQCTPFHEVFDKCFWYTCIYAVH